MDAADKIHAKADPVAATVSTEGLPRMKLHNGAAHPKPASAPKARKISKAEVKRLLPFKGLLWLPGELEPVQHPPAKARGDRRKSADAAQAKPHCPEVESRDLDEVGSTSA